MWRCEAATGCFCLKRENFKLSTTQFCVGESTYSSSGNAWLYAVGTSRGGNAAKDIVSNDTVMHTFLQGGKTIDPVGAHFQ